MKMCYARALAMPSSYAVMDEGEMTYTEGGSITLGMLKTFTDKSVCMYWAMKVIDHGSLKGMTYQQAAEEIYAHAYVYYNFHRLPSFIKNNSAAQSVYNSAADGICLQDNGDTPIRKAFYASVWALC
ncbi:MAG: hypothetical protein PUJ55_06730 [Clostridiales bacterium]|nr:hypothetical protein [Roseburia sp.]MDD7636617.1 hypothetical protein [Clostridiales bacterium]MDY4113727.1 hypothetical protein [Roseburia sp.]